jgi:hypothetical protein
MLILHPRSDLYSRLILWLKQYQQLAGSENVILPRHIRGTENSQIQHNRKRNMVEKFGLDPSRTIHVR